MTQLLPEVLRFKEVNARFERNVLNNDSKLLYDCFFDPICYENYDDMQRTVFELILNNKEVVQ